MRINARIPAATRIYLNGFFILFRKGKFNHNVFSAKTRQWAKVVKTDCIIGFIPTFTEPKYHNN